MMNKPVFFPTTTTCLQVEVIAMHGSNHPIFLTLDEYARLRRQHRQVGLAEDMPEEALAAFAKAKVPEEYTYLNELMDDD